MVNMQQAAGILMAVLVGGSAIGCGGIELIKPPAADAHRAQACVETALRRHPDPTVLAEAVSHFSHACQVGEAGGCSTLGVMYELGRAVKQDAARASQLYLLACQAGNSLACVNLGKLFRDGRGVAQSYPRAIELLALGCRSGANNGCTALADLYATGRGVEQSSRHAAGLYQRACDGGDFESCFALGNLYRDGRLPADTVATIALYERACVGGVAAGCDRLAETYRRASPANKPIPTHPRREACERGDATACAAVGLAYFSGDQVPRNVARAVRFLERACHRGYQPSCTVLGPLLQGSCTRGDAQSCQTLHRLASR